jgi:hypothetical protein
MPQGGKPIKIIGGCENCGNDAYDIVWGDGSGGEDPLERHCNQCGWTKDLRTGELRNPGRTLEHANTSKNKEL